MGEHYEEFAILARSYSSSQRSSTSSSAPVSGAHSGLRLGDAAAVFFPYYAKFLSRTDHVYHSFAMAVPVLLYACYRAITFGEKRLASVTKSRAASWFPTRHAITFPILLVLLLTAPVGLGAAVRERPVSLRA